MRRALRAPVSFLAPLLTSFVIAGAAPLAKGQTTDTPAQAPVATPSPTTAAAAPEPVPALKSKLTTDAPKVGLTSAIERALAANPTYETARLEARRADAVIRETKAAWLPTLMGNASYTHLDGNRISGGAIILAQNELAANLTLGVPLVMTRQWMNTREAESTGDSVRATAADVRRMVAYATGHAYLVVYAQKLVIVVEERARETARKHLDYAHKRHVGGVGTSLDEVRAAQEVESDDALVQAAYAGLAASEEALGILAGASEPLDTVDSPTLPPSPTLDQGLRDADRRTDVIALGLKKRTTDRAVHDAWTDYMPYMQGVLQPFYQNPATPTFPLTGYQAELVLTLPIYDGGLRYGQQREREVVRDEATVAFEAGLRQARSDVRAAFEAMKRADEALGSSRRAADMARQALDLANTAYTGGAVTNLEVIDAERTARDAETQEEVAADTARQARLTMLAVTGHFPEK